MSWLPKKTVVVPIDFSEESQHAIEVAKELVDDLSALYFVHVLFPLDTVSPGVILGDVSDEKREEQTRKSFDKLIEKHGCAGVNVEVLFGNPGLEIADFAARIGAEMIVIPSHGYHGVKRLVLGSVAERVIRHAECSVMVLRRSDAE